MPREKSKTHQAFYLTEYQYWAMQYLMTISHRSATELVEEALKYAIRYINETETNPAKPAKPKTKCRQDVYITRDTKTAMGLLKINKRLDGWSATDFARYGLRHTLGSYAERYPDMRKIKETHEDK